MVLMALLKFVQAYSEEVPFAKYNERVLPRRVVDMQERPLRPERMEVDAVWDVVQRCWAPEPASRPTIDLVQRLIQPLTTRLGPRKLKPGKCMARIEDKFLKLMDLPQLSILVRFQPREPASTLCQRLHPLAWNRSGPNRCIWHNHLGSVAVQAFTSTN